MNVKMKVLGVGIVVVASMSLAACGGASSAPSTTVEQAKTFDAKGSVEDLTIKGAFCNSQNPRVVKDGHELKIQAKGNTVAMGNIGSATLEDRSPNHGYVCVRSFQIRDVPAGEKFYTLVLDGQGEKEVSEEDLKSGRIVLITHELNNRPD